MQSSPSEGLLRAIYFDRKWTRLKIPDEINGVLVNLNLVALKISIIILIIIIIETLKQVIF